MKRLQPILTLALAACLAGPLPAQAPSQGSPNPNQPPSGSDDQPQESHFKRGTPSKKFEPTKLPKKPVDMPSAEDPEFVAARQLFWSGNYDQAEQRFVSYLAKKPDHEPTKVFLQMIHEAKHFDPEKAKAVRKALEDVRFKRIDWKDMTLDAAISFLREETRRQIPEGEAVNFVNLVPRSEDQRKITLNTEDATLNDLIKHISEQAGIFHHVDSDGIVFETKARSI